MAKETLFNLLHKTKEKYKFSITFFLLIISFGFLLVYVPLDTLGIDMAGNKIWDVLIKFASSSIISFLVRKPLFATDPLATGKSKTSLFFRKLYPSGSISDKFEVTDGEAKDLWFDFFNSWSDKNSRYHSQWRITFDRTYSCRFIYYSKVLLLFFSILSGLLLFAFLTYKLLFQGTVIFDIKNVGYFIIVTFAYLFLHRTNKVPTKNCDNPTGCWFKYEEIALIERSILKREVLDKADSFERARAIVDNAYKN